MFFILLNFFLAIVVDTFTRVKESVEDCLIEKKFPTDVIDTLGYWWASRTQGWPSPMVVEEYLNMQLLDMDEPFTAREIVLRSGKGLEFQGMDKPHKAAKWLRHYATKIWEDGRYVLTYEKPQAAGAESSMGKSDPASAALSTTVLMAFEAFLNSECPGIPDEEKMRLAYDLHWDKFFSTESAPMEAQINGANGHGANGANGDNKYGIVPLPENADPKHVEMMKHLSHFFTGNSFHNAVGSAIRTEMKRQHNEIAAQMGAT